jgi:uncharacterized cupredoxin-like copper-binding protein
MKGIVVLATVIAAVAAASTSALGAIRPAHTQAAEHETLLATVDVTASEFKFVLSKKSAGRGLVIFKVKNVGKLSHDFKINGRKTKLLKPGQSDTLRVTFLKKGHYAYTCTVKGHATFGMKGAFTIT